MKIKVISRNPDDFQRETKHDIFKGTLKYYKINILLAPRNYNTSSDPFRHQVEYTRALNAAKLERVFAKPFIAAFDGHNEAVHLLKKHPTRLSTILSGAFDGQIKVLFIKIYVSNFLDVAFNYKEMSFNHTSTSRTCKW